MRATLLLGMLETLAQSVAAIDWLTMMDAEEADSENIQADSQKWSWSRLWSLGGQKPAKSKAYGKILDKIVGV